MLAKNLNVSKGLVNGARGIIKGFDSGSAGTSSVLWYQFFSQKNHTHCSIMLPHWMPISILGWDIGKQMFLIVLWFPWKETSVRKKMQTYLQTDFIFNYFVICTCAIAKSETLYCLCSLSMITIFNKVPFALWFFWTNSTKNRFNLKKEIACSTHTLTDIISSQKCTFQLIWLW